MTIEYKIEVLDGGRFRRIRIVGYAVQSELTILMGEFPYAFRAIEAQKNAMIDFIVDGYKEAYPEFTFVWKQ